MVRYIFAAGHLLYAIADNKDDSVLQTQLAEIHSLKDQLKAENDSLLSTKQTLKDLQEKIRGEKEESRVQTSLLQSNTELRERIQADERRKIEEENAAILKDNLDTLKLEIKQEKAELTVTIIIQWWILVCGDLLYII